MAAEGGLIARPNSMYHDFEARKQAIIDQLNAPLIEAHMPTIHGVFGEL
jgi:hypothetical protein